MHACLHTDVVSVELEVNTDMDTDIHMDMVTGIHKYMKKAGVQHA